MYLKKLEIHGFKSFAKKTSFKFEPGITSIVGPNGAGKSNIADGIRWVFGEQSLKLLRGKKAADVIFAGSASHARLGGAEVIVYFDNSDRRMPIDYTEVVISRRLYREDNSQYLINGNQVRLLDIQELLANSGFGNTSYHVIGQGMIDQLILGGPLAVKELVEEASGVKPYYLKRERTLRRLERTENNLGQVEVLLREIEPRLKSLRRQTRKLERREVFEQELKAAHINYYGTLLQGFVLQIQEVNSKMERFDKEIATLKQEIGKFSSEIEKEEQTAKNSAKAFKELQLQLEALRKNKQTLLEEQAWLRAGLATEPQSTIAKISWQKIKEKLQEAYRRFKNLLENWQAEEANAVEKLLSDLLRELDTSSGELPAQNSKRWLKIESELQNLNQEIGQAENSAVDFATEEEQRKNQLFVKERLLRNKQDSLIKTSQNKNEFLVEQAKLQTRREDLEQAAQNALGPNFKEEIKQSKTETHLSDLQHKISNLKKQLEIIGGVDDLTIQEYKETEERYTYLTNQSEDLTRAMKDLKTVIEELDEIIKKDFHEAFQKISEKFAEYFRILFGGGRATMTVLREQPQADEERAEESSVPIYRREITGIEIRATPPGKKLAGIAALSGGERALASIALLCALLDTYPSPFVFLDEVDAALDEANSIRFGKILGTLADQTQFITITHNRETMRQSHTLYGVTIGENGISRVLSLKLEQAAAYSSKN